MNNSAELGVGSVERTNRFEGKQDELAARTDIGAIQNPAANQFHRTIIRRSELVIGGCYEESSRSPLLKP